MLQKLIIWSVDTFLFRDIEIIPTNVGFIHFSLEILYFLHSIYSTLPYFDTFLLHFPTENTKTNTLEFQ